MESGWNVWVWLVDVVSRRWVWLVGLGGIYGCGCKEIYRFPLILLIPTLVSALFCSSSPTFFFLFSFFVKSNGCSVLVFMYIYAFSCKKL